MALALAGSKKKTQDILNQKQKFLDNLINLLECNLNERTFSEANTVLVIKIKT